MKNKIKFASNFAVLSLLLTGFSALATGQPGTQGPRFLGMGLDEPFQNSDGSYTPGSVQSFTLVATATFPPTNESQLISSLGTANYTLTQLTCGASNGRTAYCLANVTSNLHIAMQAGMNTNPCSVSSPSQQVPLVAINAAWDPGTTSLNFNATNAVVFACRYIHPGMADPFDSIGAFGKCVGWGFLSTSSLATQFDACVRATRADYCGTGTSYTKEGTPFVVYDSPSSRRRVCRPGECFEASWTPQGASCINHLRYEALVELAQTQVASLGGADGGQQSQGAPGTTLSMNGLQACGLASTPLAACLAKYTDFYYDDLHPMNLSNPSSVNFITAQYVCLSGAQRKIPHGLLSRTKVRFTDQSGNVTPLDCCDTLKCP